MGMKVYQKERVDREEDGAKRFESRAKILWAIFGKNKNRPHFEQSYDKQF